MSYLYRVPQEVMREAGEFQEFAKDAAIVSIRIKGGRVYTPAVIVYPNYIAALEGFDLLPFREEEIEAVFQTTDDQKRRSSSSWKFFTSGTP